MQTKSEGDCRNHSREIGFNEQEEEEEEGNSDIDKQEKADAISKEVSHLR